MHVRSVLAEVVERKQTFAQPYEVCIVLKNDLIQTGGCFCVYKIQGGCWVLRAARRWVCPFLPIRSDIVLRLEVRKALVLLLRRRVAERTFAWFSQYRRLIKDYEYYLSSSEAMAYLSMIRLMLRRLARST